MSHDDDGVVVDQRRKQLHHLRRGRAPLRPGLRFWTSCHGNRNAVERVSKEIKRRTSSFSDTFGYGQSTTAERWLQVLAVWLESCSN